MVIKLWEQQKRNKTFSHCFSSATLESFSNLLETQKGFAFNPSHPIILISKTQKLMQKLNGHYGTDICHKQLFMNDF